MTIFYTKKGDCGKSALGKRMIAKDDPLFDILGKFDEVNSLIGWCRAEAKSKIKYPCLTGRQEKSKLAGISEILVHLQEDLFVAQSELAADVMSTHDARIKPKARITAVRTAEIEKIIDNIDAEIPTIKNFVISGESELSARLDVARASTRSAERALVSYSKKRPVSAELKQYINRLSSVLFALARFVNFRLKKREQNPSYR